MKKIILVLSLVLALGLGTMFVYAETTEDTEWNIWHDERMEYRRAELEEALDEGEITQEEYENWVEHFEYMEEFHEENGFINGGGFGRGCHGGARGFSEEGFNGQGFNGGGMMRRGFNGSYN